MSRLGKKPILIPEKVEVKVEGTILSVKGSLGELKKEFKPDLVEISVEGKEVKFTPKKNTKLSLSLWGTYSAHLKNMIKGVTIGFEKKLIVSGVGFKAQIEGSDLVLSLGLSHTIKVKAPTGIKLGAEKNIITVFGSDKEQVGQLSATIRSYKKPEPYKGKGIKYEDEIVKKKVGKRATASG